MIKTWQERCEKHPDHEGIVSEQMIRDRMQEEIDELRHALHSTKFLPEEMDAYERGFIEGRQDQMRSTVERAVNAMTKREWVGLTDEEIKEIVGPWGDTPIKGYTRKLFDQIEAKLKEKNT